MPRKKKEKSRSTANEYLKFERKYDPTEGTYERKFTKSLKKSREEDLDNAIRVLAKRANQRLRELEKPDRKGSTGAMNMKAYRNLENKYYEADGSDLKPNTNIMALTNKGQIKFSTNPAKLRKEEKEAELYALRGFLTSKLSSRKGIEETYSKMAQTYNEKYGVDLTANQIGELFHNLIGKNKSESVFSSEQVVELMSRTNISKIAPEDMDILINKMKNASSLEGMIRSMDSYINSEDDIGKYFKDKYGNNFTFKKV